LEVMASRLFSAFRQPAAAAAALGCASAASCTLNKSSQAWCNPGEKKWSLFPRDPDASEKVGKPDPSPPPVTPNDPEQQEYARQSFGIRKEDLIKICSEKGDYEAALEALARNVKHGPFVATSGLELPYLLNAATSLLDKSVAMQLTRMTLDVLTSKFKNRLKEDEKLVVVGGEMGGGVMAAQCCAVAPLTHTDLGNWCDFAYMRKNRKNSGTKQQLEAPSHLTDRDVHGRNTNSMPLRAVWLDDANSSGAELVKNVRLLKAEYNIEIIGAIFLVDRSIDRKQLELAKLHMANPVLKGVDIYALYDLAQVDEMCANSCPC